MAKGNGQRLKALYILKILQENSDEKHLLKTQQIIDRLEGYGIPAERKSVYADISALKELGYEIVCVRARANGGYYLKNRSFRAAGAETFDRCGAGFPPNHGKEIKAADQ